MRAAAVLGLVMLACVPARADQLAGRLKAHVDYLASDDLDGRDVGSEGIAAAEAHVAAVFGDLGLRPLQGHDSFHLPFELRREGFDPACSWGRVEGGSRSAGLVAGVDFRPFDFSGEGIVTGDVVFAGYGITAPDVAWDDYDGLDVRGRIALVLRHVPREGDPDGPLAGAAGTEHATFASKAQNAQSHGAKAILVVTDPLNHSGVEDLRLGGPLRLPPVDGAAPTASGPASPPARADAPAADQPPILAVQISRAVAERLAAGATGRSLAELQVAVDSGDPPAALGGAGARVELAVFRRTNPEIVECHDVVGVLPGSDPRLCEEWIVVGAHHDHLGSFAGQGDTVYNGADDNASGTAAVLELARMLALGQRPRRTLVFATFSAEEKGLLGSRWLVERSGFPVERVAFMLNSDMLGRNPGQPIEAIGDGFTNGLRQILEDESAGLGLDLQFGGDGYFGASDHDPFYKRDVPFLFLFTGLHDDYHQLADHSGRLDFEREARIVELSRRLVVRLADSDERPSFVHHVPWLGLEVEVLGEGASRIAVVTEVASAGRAARAGVVSGDVITAFGGAPLADATTIGARFREVEPGSTAAISLARGSSRVEATLERARPGYLGISPGPLDADERRRLGLRDDEGLVVRQVTKDGPADAAGVMAGDVLVRLAGEPVVQRTLSTLLSQHGAGETVDVLVVRDRARVKLEVAVGERPRQ